MNKKRVDNWISTAKTALIDCGIAKNGNIKKTFRGQISSFGAAVVMGSLCSAVAFFCEKNNASVDRPKLISAMYYCITGEQKTAKEVLEIVCKDRNSVELREQFIDASIAIKLAMNFFTLVEEVSND